MCSKRHSRKSLSKRRENWGTDESEENFDRVLKKVVTSKPAKDDKPDKAGR